MEQESSNGPVPVHSDVVVDVDSGDGSRVVAGSGDGSEVVAGSGDGSGVVAGSGDGSGAVADSDTDKEDITARNQIKILRWIESSTRHKKALEFWEAQDNLCTRRVDNKRKQSLALKNEVYQLIGFYSVFQGVLLTAVSQSNLLHCNNWGFPFSLSLLASCSAIVGVYLKFAAVWELEKTIESEKMSRQLYVNRIERLRSKGKKFKFSEHAKNGSMVPGGSGFAGFILGTGAVFLVLISFSAIFAAAVQRILCNPGPSLLPRQV
ncbi:uncharacterized protein [Physcomitrium patens]|uniref:Uncharacterized protein n=1 Tax=Physcomitrium patens TaxID=3218 RepID=A0A2K1IET6_PHYPA|nr:uncharacterized protein LOC112277163 [Physcomitrium patens]PNR27787.1 hypothetical protein PHYPA_029939 [Physcomitrium patens]|eukprot:XP_024364972.1 uncharacterized protein LOC112277163 [Physcomitrella patens]